MGKILRLQSSRLDKIRLDHHRPVIFKVLRATYTPDTLQLMFPTLTGILLYLCPRTSETLAFPASPVNTMKL